MLCCLCFPNKALTGAQVLVDHEILEDCWRGKIQLLERLQGCLQGAIKPMVTQCCMRALYNAKPKVRVI